MSHNINIENGQAAFFSHRQSAWHGLGQVVERPVTDAEAINLAGLNWDVRAVPLKREDGPDISSHKSLVRADTNETLGVVGSGYSIVQNSRLFEFLRGLEGYTDVTIETAGALGKGETVWVLAHVPTLQFDIKGDPHKCYLAAINYHNGMGHLTILPTCVRIVCQNTMRMATEAQVLGTLTSGFYIRHTSGIEEAIQRVQQAYVETTPMWKRTKELLNGLAAAPLSEEKITRLFTEPWDTPQLQNEDAEPETPTILATTAERADERQLAKSIREGREKRLREILASQTCQLPGTKDTLFSAYNAVTEYVEYEGVTRVRGDVSSSARNQATRQQRFKSANLGGNGDRVKARAFKLALSLV